MNNPLMNKLLMILLILLVAFALLYVALYFINILMPFIIGFIIAAIANPLTKTLRALKLNRSLASLIAVLLVLSIVIGAIYLLFYLTRNQFSFIVQNIKHLGISMMRVLRDSYNELAHRFPAFFTKSFEEFLQQNTPTFSKALTDNSLLLGGRLFTFAKSLPSMAFFLIITLISSYYISIEYDRLRKWLAGTIQHYPRIQSFISRIKGSASMGLGSWFKAQLAVMSVLGVIASLGFYLIGYSHPLMMGIGLALFDALPIFGSGAVLMPLILYNLLFGRIQRAIWHVLLYIAISATRQLIEPRILGRQIGINPLITLLSIYLGFRLAGFLGILLGVMALVVIMSIYGNKSHVENKKENSSLQISKKDGSR